MFASHVLLIHTPYTCRSPPLNARRQHTVAAVRVDDPITMHCTSGGFTSSPLPQPLPFSRLTKLLLRGVSFLTARPNAPFWVP
ncbi:hypothetical protein CC86DRAFT_193667 [Ophiobolus disseminans]|uniref:Uncharacterized protein n=1 Tax=Ophiobolus disseminans TaxID=1469910 RepID=A0A6A7A6P0_9PLEO|nr:hypothetical protein CC86DRAFT_193667 [Ophiobolus disseminans]